MPNSTPDWWLCNLYSSSKRKIFSEKKTFLRKKIFSKKSFYSSYSKLSNLLTTSSMLKVLIITILCQGCENKVFAIISKKAVVSYYYYILHNYHCTKKTHFYGCDYVSKSNKKAILIRNLLFCTYFKNIAIYIIQLFGKGPFINYVRVYWAFYWPCSK